MYPLIPTNTVIDIKRQPNRQLSCRKEDTNFFRILPSTKWGKKAIDITDGGSIISETINMGF